MNLTNAHKTKMCQCYCFNWTKICIICEKPICPGRLKLCPTCGQGEYSKDKCKDTCRCTERDLIDYWNERIDK